MSTPSPLCPTDRYVVLYQGAPVYTTERAQDLILYLWGRQIGATPRGPYDYVVLDYEVPHVVDTANICAWLARVEDE